MIDVIHHLKYHRQEELSECLGRWLFRFWQETWAEASEPEVIVPVPLHPWRLWKRGFNQSASLGEVLSRLSGVPLVPPCLRRTRRTRSQTRMTTRQRFQNVANAFETASPLAVRNKRVLLIDDVMTTGATLCAAAQALRKAGATTVWGLTVARAL